MPAYSSPGVYSGLEYTLSKDGGKWPEGTNLALTHGSPEPFTFSTIEMEFPDPTVVHDYNVSVRYYVTTVIQPPAPIDPDTGDAGELPPMTMSVTYPPWNLIAQEMQRAEEKFYFENESGTNLFAAEPGVYGNAVAGISNTTEGLPLPPANPDVNDPNFVPLIVDNKYSYCRIFNQAELDWIPRCSPDQQPAISGKVAPFPSEPYLPDGNNEPTSLEIVDPGDGYDRKGTLENVGVIGGQGIDMRVNIKETDGGVTEVKFNVRGTGYRQGDIVRLPSPGRNCVLRVQNPPVYPIDGIVSFIPDEREIVNVTYTLSTESDVAVESITITHPVSQRELDIRAKLRGTMDKSYYGRGFIHQGLYPPVTDRIYDDGGRLINGKTINEPFNIRQIRRKTYPYDKERYDWRPHPEPNPSV